jgi:hypothetical protein
MSDIYFNRSEGNYNFARPSERQAYLFIGGLPPEAPGRSLSETVDIDGPYDYQGDDLWEMLDAIEGEVERMWISTAREQQRLVIKWMRENRATLNVGLTKARAVALQKAAKDAADRARSAVYDHEDALEEAQS